MAFQFMPLYTGDYLRDTRGLTLAQHGAYLLLLMEQWNRGMAIAINLPSELTAFCRVVGAHDAVEIEAVKYVLDRFFEQTDGGWSNPRIAREIEKSKQISDKRSEAGRKGAHGKWDGKQDGKKMAKATTSTTTTTYTKTIGHHDDRFSEFWILYPKKVGKGAAEKAWKKADAEAVLKALPTYPFSDDPKFIPHPATWLNQRRWEDEPAGSSDSSWLKEVAR